jgi:hypothetical protein
MAQGFIMFLAASGTRKPRSTLKEVKGGFVPKKKRVQRVGESHLDEVASHFFRQRHASKGAGYH